MTEFNHRKFLVDHWGNPVELFRFLQSYGYKEVKQQTVNAWFRRGSTPSDWFPVLTALLELDRGKPVSTAEYLK